MVTVAKGEQRRRRRRVPTSKGADQRCDVQRRHEARHSRGQRHAETRDQQQTHPRRQNGVGQLKQLAISERQARHRHGGDRKRKARSAEAWEGKRAAGRHGRRHCEQACRQHTLVLMASLVPGGESALVDGGFFHWVSRQDGRKWRLWLPPAKQCKCHDVMPLSLTPRPCPSPRP